MKEGPAEAGVGAALRKRRMLRGQSVEAIHQHTRIPKALIEALEEERYDDFPAKVYIRGFLKSYCDYLELDFDGLWAKIDPGAGAPAHPANGPASRDSGEGGRGFALPFTESTILPLAMFAALLGAGGLLWFFKSGDAPRPPAEPAASEARVEVSTLTVVAVRDGWMRLQADGELRYEGNIPAGARQEWTARRGFSLRVSDIEAFRFGLNGRETPLAGLVSEPDGSFLLSP